MNKLILPALAAGAVVVALAGCSATATTNPNSVTNSVAAQAPAPVKTTPAPDKVDPNPAFGQTVTYPDKIQVTVSLPGAFTPSAYAAGGKAPVNEDFKVTVKNGGATNFNPSLVTDSATAGGVAATEVYDSTSDLNGSPSTPILPGQSLSWTVGFNLVSASGVTVAVSPDFSDASTVWSAK